MAENGDKYNVLSRWDAIRSTPSIVIYLRDPGSIGELECLVVINRCCSNNYLCQNPM